MDSKQRRQQVQRLLHNRELIYVGPRGADSLPLASLGSLGAVFSLIAPAEPGVPELCLESMSKVRVDLNAYSLDEDRSEPAVRFREALLEKFLRPCAVITYSPSRTVSQGWLIAQDTVLPLGLFYEQQSPFDYKPWVERELNKLGVSTIPWIYTHTLSDSIITDLLESKPVVVRWPRSRGGSGIWLARNREDLTNIAKSPSGDVLFCVAPYFETATSVNVNACAFPNGDVSIHGSSVQLVGIDICTPRPLGYAGNDFSSISELPTKALKGLDLMTRSLGSWLARHGYLGAFGFDALVLEDSVLFVELNPRFQASSVAASMIDNYLDRPDQYIEHMSAFLGLEVANRLSLQDLVTQQEPLSQILIYNGRNVSVDLRETPRLKTQDIRLLPGPGIAVEPQATLASILWNGWVTEVGCDIRQEARTAVLDIINCFSPTE